MAEEPKKKKPSITGNVTEATAARNKNLQTQGAEGDRARAREATLNATGAARMQEASANKGTYAGLGLAERAQAERMVREGKAKDREDAAGQIRGAKKPKPSSAEQAKALSK